MTYQVKTIGHFKVKSGKINVTDPCYSLDVWCRGEVEVENGDWAAQVEYIDCGDWGCRVKSLSCWNIDICSNRLQREVAVFEVGVDSGQAGFFDFDAYPEHGASFTDGGDGFYAECCSKTNSNESAGIVRVNGEPIGVVATSGFGDGGYQATLLRNEQGNVEEIELIFIEEEEIQNGE